MKNPFLSSTKERGLLGSDLNKQGTTGRFLCFQTQEPSPCHYFFHKTFLYSLKPTVQT